MLKSLGCAIVAFTLATPLTAAAGDLRLSIANGRVTLIAQDVSLKQILDEWARVGQTTIVGAERLLGQSVTIELQDVPEGRALETLLRSASGYIAKPRAVMAAGGSSYDRIMIMPASRAPAASSVPTQFTNRPQPMINPTLMVDDDEPNGNNNVLPPGALPPGAVGQMNGPQPMQPQMYPGAPPAMPGAQPPPNVGGANAQQPPLTAPRPGQLPPPMPAFPGNPYQMPPQPGSRPPGGGGGQ
jgi:hypothetical protein